MLLELLLVKRALLVCHCDKIYEIILCRNLMKG